jgi:ferredoxin-type protein NapH
MRKFSVNEVVASKGWFGAYKWLLLRRLTQLSLLSLFLLGPWFGVWIVKGNLASSLTLEVLPLTDPYILLQSILAGHTLEITALIGALIILIFYLVIGGRVYCSWVCPLNIVTDAAASLRECLDIKGKTQLSRRSRYWILAMSLIVAALTGTIAWELLNPVSMLYRGLIFGMGLAYGIVIAIFFFDLLLNKHGWCGHLCPVGAFYSLLGRFSWLRIKATQRSQCDNCMDCFRVCPEPQVIKPALKGAEQGIGPVILAANCTNCGQCIDICTKNVFEWSTRFHNQDVKEKI